MNIIYRFSDPDPRIKYQPKPPSLSKQKSQLVNKRIQNCLTSKYKAQK